MASVFFAHLASLVSVCPWGSGHFRNSLPWVVVEVKPRAEKRQWAESRGERARDVDLNCLLPYGQSLSSLQALTGIPRVVFRTGLGCYGNWVLESEGH